MEALEELASLVEEEEIEEVAEASLLEELSLELEEALEEALDAGGCPPQERRAKDPSNISVFLTFIDGSSQGFEEQTLSNRLLLPHYSAEKGRMGT